MRDAKEIAAFVQGFEVGCDELLDAHEALSQFMQWLGVKQEGEKQMSCEHRSYDEVKGSFCMIDDQKLDSDDCTMYCVRNCEAYSEVD